MTAEVAVNVDGDAEAQARGLDRVVRLVDHVAGHGHEGDAVVGRLLRQVHRV